MSKKKSKAQPRSNYEVYRSIRKDWGRYQSSDKSYSRQEKQETEA